MSVRDCVIGIDVGTGSARAGVFDRTGQMLGSAKAEIALHRDAGGVAEQSSAEIWSAVCGCVRRAVAEVGADRIAGVGFDATCSLVLVGADGSGVPVGTSGDPSRDIIVWMDHRALDQTARINATGHDVLRYVGGRISPEMETPKLLWLSEHLPASFDAAWQFFDLADFLTWKATGSLARSTCTVTCKWTYLAHEDRWDASYFRQIGLGVLADEGFARIGTEIVAPGTALGDGLTAEAAEAMGLRPGTQVGAGLIDAHAGGVGTVGAMGGPGTVTSRMAYVFGTSACTMSSTREPGFVPGVWGPYFAAMIPGLWLNEGGQSAAGASIDRMLRAHPAFPEASGLAQGTSVPDWIGRRLAGSYPTLSDCAKAAGRMVVVPDFLGNRSPFANPGTKAVVAGLGMETGLDDLAAQYVAGVCGLGYGLRQIVEAQATNGVRVDTIVISGGAGASRLVRQLIADATGLPVAVPAAAEPVLLGAAILGAASSGLCADLEGGMREMTAFGEVLSPSGEMEAWHRSRFAAFEALRSAMAGLAD